jgi:hypothetical protein
MELPSAEKSWEYENGFYLTCQPNRLGKFLAHYELFKETLHLPGAIVECGVFKGISLCRFAMMRELFGNADSRHIIGFDIFGDFPQTEFEDDKSYRQRYVDAAGSQSIGKEQLEAVLGNKGVGRNLELVAGNICETVPRYLEENPHLRISLLNLDVDIYEPSVTILEHLYPRLVPGGVLVLDDYGVFPGETTAVDEYFRDQQVEIQKFPFAATPSFVRK